MTVFRPLRSTLEQSLKERKEFYGIKELCSIIEKELSCWPDADILPENIEIKPYGYDRRIEWHTQLVIIKNVGMGIDGPMGFLNEPIGNSE